MRRDNPEGQDCCSAMASHRVRATDSLYLAAFRLLAAFSSTSF